MNQQSSNYLVACKGVSLKVAAMRFRKPFSIYYKIHLLVSTLLQATYVREDTFESSIDVQVLCRVASVRAIRA